MCEESDYPNPVQKFYYEELRWCGCGSPDEALEFMAKVLRILLERSDDSMAERSGVPYKESAHARHTERLNEALSGALGLSYMYMIDALELTEHGGSVFGSWLTEKGKGVLAMLEEADLEDAMDEELRLYSSECGMD